MRNRNRKQVVLARGLAILLALLMIISVVALLPSEAQAASKKPARVTLTKVEAMNQMITVKWKKAARAKSYEVYAKAGSARWKKVATVKSSGKSTELYKITGCKWKTKYQIKVRAVSGGKKGEFSKIKSAKTWKKTTLQKMMNSAVVKRELTDVVEAFQDEMLSIDLKCSGNTLRCTLKFHEIEGLDASDFAEIGTEISAEYNSEDMRKNMHELIADLEDNTGVTGIKFQVLVLSPAGKKLASCTYK